MTQHSDVKMFVFGIKSCLDSAFLAKTRVITSPKPGLLPSVSVFRLREYSRKYIKLNNVLTGGNWQK